MPETSETETTFLTSDNVESFSDCDVVPYPLPGFPGVSVHVKHQPIATMKRLSKLLNKGGEHAEVAQCETIQLSIVNPDGSAIYTPEKAKLLKTGKTRLFAALVQVIGKLNTPRSDDATESEVEALGNV